MGRTPIWIIGAMLVATLLAGCREDEVVTEDVVVTDTAIQDTMPAAKPQVFCYKCDDGLVFTLYFADRSEPNEATLSLPGRTHRLPLVETSEGERYWRGGVAFWRLSDTEANLEIQGEVLRRCTLDQARTQWADAKLRGVSYRALGNEPGWSLEIDPTHMVWVSDHGETRHVFPTGSPDVDRAARRTVWRSSADGHDIEVLVSGEPCLDDGDMKYPTTVTITFDGRTFPGCGRALN